MPATHETGQDVRDHDESPAALGLAVGSFDMFHVGHLRALRAAVAECHGLVVGVATDRLVHRVTGVVPVVGHDDRAEVVDGFGLAVRIDLVDVDDVEHFFSGRGEGVLFVSRGGAKLYGAPLHLSPRIHVIEAEPTRSDALGRLVTSEPLWALSGASLDGPGTVSADGGVAP